MNTLHITRTAAQPADAMPPATASITAETDRLVHQALSDTRPVQVFVRDEIIAHSVSKTILAAASPKLEQLCNDGDNIITLAEGSGALRILIGWVLKRVVTGTDQLALAEASVLTVKFEIRHLQDAIRPALHSALATKDKKVCPKAVAVAYRHAGLSGIQDTFARRIFDDIAASHSDQRVGWDFKDLKISGLDTNTAFLSDFFARTARKFSTSRYIEDLKRRGTWEQTRLLMEGDEDHFEDCSPSPQRRRLR